MYIKYVYFLGLQIKTPDGSMATAQMLLKQTFAEQVEKVKNDTGIELPKYYNPAAMNPLKYANQVHISIILYNIILTLTSHGAFD